jgi:hypothetical protein
MIQNEVIFREYNERVQASLEEFKRLADKEGHKALAQDTDIPLHFYCECSDENCRQRVVMRPSTYAEIHENRRRFVMVPGHEVDAIESVMSRHDDYSVVEKKVEPPETADRLKPTPISNV